MRKGVLKGLMITGMALILAIPLAGCKKASKTEDPKAAKDYVFKYENLQINFPNSSGDSYYDVTSVDVADGKGYAVTSTYDYETGENLSFLITVDPNTKSTDVNPLEKPDFSEFRPEQYVNEDGFWENTYIANLAICDGQIVGTTSYSASFYGDTDYFSLDK